MTLTVVRTGPQTTVQDLGRIGLRDVGVSVGGALDTFAARVANLLVGNVESAALLELTLGGIRLRFSDERAIAWCGAAFTVRVGETPLPGGHVALVRADEELKIEHSERGCRGWLAVSGGIDVPLVLGSRSTDLRARFGGFEGRRLQDGDRLQVGAPVALPNERVASWGAPSEWADTARRAPVLRVLRAADWRRFRTEAQRAFLHELFTVTSESDRMGARLDGPKLQRADAGDLFSEAVTPGTIQVPSGGDAIVLLGDCQTIGGYPKIAHVITVDLPVAAQLRDGDQVSFREIALAEAHRLLIAREEEFQRFRVGVQLRAGR